MEIEFSKPCCEVWPKIMGRFNWMYFSENEEILTTPHIQSSEHRFFINHCPSCGKEVRNYTVHIDDVEISRSLTGDLL